MVGHPLEPSPYLSALAARLRAEMAAGWSLLANEDAGKTAAKVRHQLLKTSPWWEKRHRWLPPW